MSNLSQPVDQYCERLHAGLFAEPLNLVTNLAFILAAYFLYQSYKNHSLKNAFLLFLISMVAIIGLGSSAFHSFATTGTMLMDIIPITIFLLSYIAYVCRNVCSFPWWLTTATLTLFLLLGYLTGFAPVSYALNGTISYVPALFFLFIIANHIQKIYPTSGQKLWLALGLLLISMTFRTVDMLVCDIFPIGTHFLWHSLNGIVLYLAISGLLHISATKKSH